MGESVSHALESIVVNKSTIKSLHKIPIVSLLTVLEVVNHYRHPERAVGGILSSVGYKDF